MLWRWEQQSPELQLCHNQSREGRSLWQQYRSPRLQTHPLYQPHVLLLSQPRDNGDQSERALSHQSSMLFTLSSARPGGGVWVVGVCRGGLATQFPPPHRAPHPLQPGVTPSRLSKRGSGSSGHKDSSIPLANKGRSVLDGAEPLARPAALPSPPLRLP